MSDEEDKDGESDKPDSTSPDGSVQPVAVVESTFPSATTSQKGKGSGNKNVHSMPRELAVPKPPSSLNIKKEAAVKNTDVDENENAVQLGAATAKGPSTGSVSKAQLRQSGKKVSVGSYVTSSSNQISVATCMRLV